MGKKEDFLDNLSEKVAEKDVSRVMKSLSVTFERVGIGIAIAVVIASLAVSAYFINNTLTIAKLNENCTSDINN